MLKDKLFESYLKNEFTIYMLLFKVRNLLPLSSIKKNRFVEYFKNKISRFLYSFSHLFRFMLIKFRNKEYRWYGEGKANLLNIWVKRLKFEKKSLMVASSVSTSYKVFLPFSGP